MVQLDKTEIAIRQRSTLELLDLSMVVLRRYWWQLAASSALLGLPLLALNVWLTGWMLGEQGRFAMADLESPEDAQQNRYLLHFFALYFLQFPLVSLPATVLIGNQIFFEQLSLRKLLKELKPIAWRAVWVLGFLRMGLMGILIELMIDREGTFDGFLELFLLLFLCCGIAAFRRAAAPFAPEILGLEACKLRVRSKNELSYRRRSRSLHGALASDNIGRFFICSIVVSILVAMLYSLTFVGDFVGLRRSKVELFHSLLSNQALIQVVLPLSLWIAGIYATVFRFLSYLDSRIRLEGWEVELQLKAERTRLLQSMHGVSGTDSSAIKAPQLTTTQVATPQSSSAMPMVIQPLDNAPGTTTSSPAVGGSGSSTMASWLIWIALGVGALTSIGCYSQKVSPSSDPALADAAQKRAVDSLGNNKWYDTQSREYLPPQPEPVPDDPIRINGRIAPPETTPPPTATTGNNWWSAGDLDLSFFVWTLLVAVLIGLLMLLFFNSAYFMRRRQRLELSTKAIEINPARVVDLPFEAAVEMHDPLAYAKQLIAAGDYDGAILFLYGYMLLALDRAGKLTLHRGKTNRMYLFELGGERALRDILSPTMLAFEDVFFGRHSIGADRFQRLWLQLDEFHRLLSPAIAAAAPLPQEAAS